MTTGRGGAGNAHSANDIQPSKSPVYYSTGRGGAGNIKLLSKVQLPKLVPQGLNTPQLTQPKFTTGRGGYGNMVDNSNPKFTRKLQDVDGPQDLYAVALNKSFSVGRGGFGNVVSKTRLNALEDNLYTVVSQGSRKAKEKRGFAEKVKSFFS